MFTNRFHPLPCEKIILSINARNISDLHSVFAFNCSPRSYAKTYDTLRLIELEETAKINKISSKFTFFTNQNGKERKISALNVLVEFRHCRFFKRNPLKNFIDVQTAGKLILFVERNSSWILSVFPQIIKGNEGRRVPS